MAFNLGNGAPTFMQPRRAVATPYVTGPTSVGSLMTATVNTGGWVGARNTFAYQWYRGTSSVANATSASYGVDAGARTTGTVTCVITVTNPWGSKTANAVYAITLP